MSTLEKLEEGLFKMKGKGLSFAKSFLFKVYACYLSYFLCVVLVRHPPIETSAAAPRRIAPISSNALLFSSMVARPSSPLDPRRIETLELLQRAMKEQNYTCLSAIHLGIPVRILRLNTTIMINPTILSQGPEVSKAHETSAFFPEREAMFITRFIPVLVEFSTPQEEIKRSRLIGADAHCVLHMINQFRGRTIYD